MFTFFILVAVSIYFLARISRLEDTISNLEKRLGGETKRQPTQTQPAVPPTVASPPPLSIASSFVKPPEKLDLPKSQNLEFEFGSKAFTIVGGLAVLLGVGFFLRYAFQQNLITETARIVLGVIAGVGLMGAGEYLRKKFDEYGQLLIGLGLALLYLTIFAAYNFYHLIGMPSAFICMIAVTIVGIAAAIRANSQGLSLFSQLGGFITPFLLNTGTNQPHALFIYIVLLNLVILILSYYKPWNVVTTLNFVGTVIVFYSWYFAFYTQAQFTLAIVYSSIFFAIFLISNLLHYYKQEVAANEHALVFTVSNAGVYFITSYILINPIYPKWMGLFTVCLAVLYFIMGLFSPTSTERLKHLKTFHWAVAFVLLVIAVPIQLERFWISIVWAAQALAFVYLGFQIKSREIRGIGQALFLLAAFRVVFFDSNTGIADPWTNTRFTTSILVAGMMLAAMFIYWSKRIDSDTQTEGEQAIALLSVESYFLLFYAVTFDILKYYDSIWLPITWSVLTVGLGILGLVTRNKVVRYVSYVGFAVIGFKLLFGPENVDLRSYTPVANLRAFSFAVPIVIFALFASLLKRHEQLPESEKKNMVALFSFSANLFLLWLVSLEVLDVFNQRQLLENAPRSKYSNIKNTSLSVAWTFYAVATLIIGIVTKSSSARIFASGLFTIVVLKVFLYDTVSLNNFYRFVSYITLGIILLISGYLYNRYKDRIIQFIKVD